MFIVSSKSKVFFSSQQTRLYWTKSHSVKYRWTWGFSFREHSRLTLYVMTKNKALCKGLVLPPQPLCFTDCCIISASHKEVFCTSVPTWIYSNTHVENKNLRIIKSVDEWMPHDFFFFFFPLQAFSAPLDFIGRHSWCSVTSVKSDIPHPSEEHSVIYLKLSSTDVWVQSISLLALWCQIQPENNCDYKGKERSGLAPQLCLSAWVKCMQSCNYNWTAYAIAVHTTQSDMQTYTGWLKMWHSGLSIGGKKKEIHFSHLPDWKHLRMPWQK